LLTVDAWNLEVFCYRLADTIGLRQVLFLSASNNNKANPRLGNNRSIYNNRDSFYTSRNGFDNNNNYNNNRNNFNNYKKNLDNNKIESNSKGDLDKDMEVSQNTLDSPNIFSSSNYNLVGPSNII
jgi:hypothetical protein